MYYLQSRYYGPVVGRFINADEMAFAVLEEELLTKNSFTYCCNDCIDYVDEYGNKRKPKIRKYASFDKAIKYAKKWWDGNNPEFSYSAAVNSGDCANFVSQCLYAAGFYMNSDWYYYRLWALSWHKLKVSNAWGNAHGLYSYLKKLSKNKRSVLKCTVIKSIADLNKVIQNREFDRGNVAFHMKESDPKKAGHAMFVGTRTRDNIFFWAHTGFRDGDNIKGYGFRDMLKQNSKRYITIFKINYSYARWQ